jgi:hypothetical protein
MDNLRIVSKIHHRKFDEMDISMLDSLTIKFFLN